ncbi:MAG: hypothetical protein ABSG81_14645 [Acidimicrobiales bacterium]
MARPPTPLVEPIADGPGSESFLGVHTKDDGHHRRLVFVHGKAVVLAVDVIAKGSLSSAPATSGGLAFHAGNDPVDDGRSFELSEDPQHLHHHPSRRRGGVEGFGR